MEKKIVIAGGTGFIGTYLTDEFRKLGYKVYVISRSSHFLNWKEEHSIIKALENAEILINLSGKSVDCRYTYKNKWKILTSRTQSTLKLHQLVGKCENPPKLWINSSTATIYRHAEDRPMTESSGEIGTGFSVHVAQCWENAFFSMNHEKTRQIALRIAIVLGDSGALKPITALTKIGFGGKQGNGKQKFSWIHIEDVFRIIQFIQQTSSDNQIYNCSAPNPVNNEVFMKTMRHSLNRKIAIPIPTGLLKFGAFFIRTEEELILKSRWVLPEKLLNEGFEFKYLTVENALSNIFKTQTPDSQIKLVQKKVLQ